MSIYVCKICGYTFDEEKEGISLKDYGECPICHTNPSNFRLLPQAEMPVILTAPESSEVNMDVDLNYAMELRRKDEKERHMLYIHQMAVGGESIIESEACGCQVMHSRLNIEASAKRVYYFMKVSIEELKKFAKITGNDDVHKLSVADLCTVDSDISDNTNIPHA